MSGMPITTVHYCLYLFVGVRGVVCGAVVLCVSTYSQEEQTSPKRTTMTLQPWKIWPENNEIKLFSAEEEKEWESPWYFIQGADPQYGLIERYINKNPVPNWDKEIELTEKLVEKINLLRPRPRFFAVCGDLCDAVPSAEPETFRAQEDSFKRIFGGLHCSIPILVTCGNHDVGDIPSLEDLQIYRAAWGDDYYSFWAGGIFFVVINTQYFMNSQNVTEYAKKHDAWLEEQLCVAKSIPGTRVIMLQHIPWFLNSADEHQENNYFTVGKEVCHNMLDKLIDAGVEKVFCGHYHRNAGGMYKNMEVVVSSAIGGQLGCDKSGIRLVKVYKDRIEHKYYAMEDIPSTVKL